MQQVYDILHHKMEESAFSVAANIRSFLKMDPLLPPPRTMRHADPTLFQILDHTFTRKQWLHSINKCRSKLYTGFPSDHYLLVTDVQVKLAAKVSKTPKPPMLRIDFSEDSRREFNAIVKELWEEDKGIPDHNAGVIVQGPWVVVYTDGSGTRGKCSRQTAAGLGECYLHEGEWVEAFGPVQTDPQHPQIYGAQVGSNNTGELTAILEAILGAAENNWASLTIRSDSLWSINVIKGKWRAKHHKTLVNYILTVIRGITTKITLQWIKGHAGHEGNERAREMKELINWLKQGNIALHVRERQPRSRIGSLDTQN